MKPIYIGTAAWSIPKDHRDSFPPGGSLLEMYSQVLNAVEINSSFYRDHKAVTYARWAQSVPEHFRFSVKLSKVFTHQQHLKTGEKKLAENLEAPLHLGSRWGCLLVQIPPSLAFDRQDAFSFFKELRQSYQGPVAFETRHASWTTPQAFELFQKYRLSAVIADPDPYGVKPEIFLAMAEIIYFRLHGSPEIYKSDYSERQLQDYAEQMKKRSSSSAGVWCIFDNTTFGHATENALRLQNLTQARDSTFPNPSVRSATMKI